MANSKISALTSAATVAGTEVLPIVQSSATVKVSVANLTPGLDTITAAKGGTGQTSYAVGDLLYANTTTTLAKLADVATGNAVISGGVGVAPSYGKIGLTTHVSGTLPVANGGTNLTSFTANGVVYASSTSALATGSALSFDGALLTSTRLRANTGSTNATTYNTISGVGGSTLTVQQQQTTSVSTSAVVILTPALYVSFIVVFGSDGTNRFVDCILAGLGTGTVNVISSLSASSTPASRTYSQSGSTYRVAMGSGTYTVQVSALSMTG